MAKAVILFRPNEQYMYVLRDASGRNGVGDEYWYQRGSREDAGQSFMGFGAGLGAYGSGDRDD